MASDLVAHLWPYSRVSGGLDYDKVRFDTQYANQDVQGFGGHAQVEQRLLPNVKLALGSQLRQSERDYDAGIYWLTPSIKGLETEIGLDTRVTNELTANQRYYTTGLRLNVAFNDRVGGEHQATYADLDEEGSDLSLLDWTRTPAVRMSHVLAVADGSTVATFLSCPQTVTFDHNSGGKNYFTGDDGWTGNSDEFYGTSNIVFNTATYSVSSSQAKCIYDINYYTVVLVMTNANAGESVGNNWGTSDPHICSSDSATQCRFNDKRI